MDYARMGVEIALKNQEYLAKLAEMNSKTQQFAKQNKSSFEGLGKWIGGAALAVGSKIAWDYIKNETKEAQIAQAQLGSVIASTGGKAGVSAEQANKLAGELSGLTAVDDDVIVSAEAVLLRFRNMSEKVFPGATQAALDLSAATGKDLNSAALTVGKAIDSMGQNTAALDKAGIGLTEREKQKAAAFAAAGDKAAAQKVVIDALARATGGSAAAQADTLDGSLRRMSITAGNLAAIMGNRLTPGFVVLSKEMSKSVSGGAIASAIEWIGDRARQTAVSIAYVIFWIDELFSDTASQIDEHMKVADRNAKYAQKLQNDLIDKYGSMKAAKAAAAQGDAQAQMKIDLFHKSIQSGNEHLDRANDITADRAKRLKDMEDAYKGVTKAAYAAMKAQDESQDTGNKSSENTGKILNYSGSVLVGNFAASKANSDLAKSLLDRAAAAETAAEKSDLLKKAAEAEAESKHNLIAGYQDIISYTQKMIGAVDSLFQAQAQAEATALENRKKTLDAFIDYSMKKELEMAGVQDLTRSQSAEKQIMQLQKQISMTGSLSKKKALQEQLIQAQNERTKYKIIEEAEEKKKKLEIIYDIFKRAQTIKEFERQKAFQYGITAMNMAAGMLGAVAQGVSQLGPIAGAIVGGIEAAAIGALGAVQMAAIVAQKAPAYEWGSSYVPDTGLAMLHRGERVVTAKDNEALNRGDAVLGRPGGDVIINVHGSIMDKIGFLKAVKDAFSYGKIKFAPAGLW